MKRAFYLLMFAAAVYVAYVPAGHSKGLGTLAEVGKSQEAFARILNAETEAYNHTKDAIASGEIKPGIVQREVLDICGSPVVILPLDGGIKKWVYKPAYASFFDSMKIYLYFGKDGTLIKIEHITNNNK